MLVRDVMTEDVKTIDPESNVKRAAELMREYKVGSLVVVKNDNLVGIITEDDIIEKVVAENKNPEEVKVRDIMSGKVIVTSPDTEIEEAARVMVKYNIKKLPVIFEGVLVGIITASDIVAAEPKLMEEIEGFVLLARKKGKIAG